MTYCPSLKVKRLNPDVKFPTFATDDAACFDIYNDEKEVNVIQSKKSVKFKTGLAMEIPKGYFVLIYSRSGHGFKNGVRLSNCVGVIDADYRGELMVSLINDSFESFTVQPGDRIAQGMLMEIPTHTLDEVDSISETARGTGGLGSTGN